MNNSNYDIDFYEKSFSNKKSYLNSFLEFDEIYHPPYVKFNEIISKIISKNSKVLDLCVGDGIHSVKLAKISKNYTALEPTKSGIKILKLRFDHECISNFKIINTKIEKFNSNSKFDFISIINSTSYFDIKELTRIYNNNLKKGGNFLIIDSLRTNPIYRLNHLINVVKGKRSMKTINRIFTYSGLILFINNLDKSKEETYFYGPFLFLSIFFKKIGLKRISKKISTYPIKVSNFKIYSFKFLTIITK